MMLHFVNQNLWVAESLGNKRIGPLSLVLVALDESSESKSNCQYTESACYLKENFHRCRIYGT